MKLAVGKDSIIRAAKANTAKKADTVQKAVENKEMTDKTTNASQKPVNTVIGNINPEVLSSIRCDLPIHLL